jgi:hypothetical protein
MTRSNNCYVAFDKEDELDTRKQDDNPHIATLTTSDGVNLSCFHETGNGNLVGFDDLRNVSVLARHESVEREEVGRLACLSMKISEGQLTLLGPSIEYPLTQEPVLSLLSTFSSGDVQSFESSRCGFIRLVLQDLGLTVPNDLHHLCRLILCLSYSLPLLIARLLCRELLRRFQARAGLGRRA